MMNKGLFITFEGGEGCGKSTISKIIKERLINDGYDVLWTREPGGTPIAEAIRGILLDPNYKEMLPATEALLYAASRTQHTLEKIVPALEEGKIVISDRYIGSSIAYQGWARNLGIKNIETINDFGIKGFRPDIEFFINIEPEIGLERAGRIKELDRLEQESIAFHKVVHSGFEVDAAIKSYVVTIDGHGTIEEISDEIYKIIQQKLYQKHSFC